MAKTGRNIGERSALLRSLSPSPEQQGILVAGLVLLIVALILIPLPARILDFFLVINIVLALVLLLRSLLLSNPVKLLSFPTILLLATLFRLALNVSSTRLILLKGDQGIDSAGEVIRAFGMFVVQGEFFVGLILFAIIAVVNFVVIAKGSARVAEVAARFALDAMPGKQLAIDADLRAGLITREQADLRREELTRESQFFGAMDGAMKFVQGDAIAGLVIVFVNAIGGISLGVSRGLGFSEAVDAFGILTIGDGMVNIVPSLLMSLCAGIIVTHVSSPTQRGSAGEIYSQFSAEPIALGMAGVALCVLGIIGMPFIPFFGVGALLGLSAYALRRSVTSGDGAELGLERDEPEFRALPYTPQGAATLPRSERGRPMLAIEADSGDVTALRLEVDPKYLALYLEEADATGRGFVAAFEETSEQHYRDRGVSLPAASYVSNPRLDRGSYRVLVRGQLVRSGRVPSNAFFVPASASTLAVFGCRSFSVLRHPLDNRASAWVEAETATFQALRHLNFDILTPTQFLALELLGAAMQVVDEIFGLDEVKKLVTDLRERHRNLVEEVFDKGVLSYSEFTELVRRLVRERVNIRDMKLILEGVAEFASLQPNPRDRQDWMNELHSFLRLVLARTIIGEAVRSGDRLRVFSLSSEIEEEFRSALGLWEQARMKPPLDPVFEGQLRESSKRIFGPVLDRGVVPVVVLCAGDVRAAVQDFFGRLLPNADWVRTIAYQELDGSYQPESIGVVTVSS